MRLFNNVTNPIPDEKIELPVATRALPGSAVVGTWDGAKRAGAPWTEIHRGLFEKWPWSGHRTEKSAVEITCAHKTEHKGYVNLRLGLV